MRGTRAAIHSGGGSDAWCPRPVLAQVWRGGARQALLSRFLNLPIVEVDLLTRSAWLAAACCAARQSTATSSTPPSWRAPDHRDARTVITSDPDDLRRLDPGLTYWTRSRVRTTPAAH